MFTRIKFTSTSENSKISDFEGILKMGRFGGLPWAKKLRQWLKLYFSSQRATYPKIRRATRRPENYCIFAHKYCTIIKLCCTCCRFM